MILSSRVKKQQTKFSQELECESIKPLWNGTLGTISEGRATEKMNE